MITSCTVDHEALRERVWDMIKTNGLIFSNKREFIPQQRLHLFCLLGKNKWYNLDEEILQKLYECFGGKYDIDYIFKQCKKWGCEYIPSSTI